MTAAEKQSTAVLMRAVDTVGIQMSALFGAMLPMLGELERRGAFRGEGATSMSAWIADRCGVSASTGRVWAVAAGYLWDLPQLTAALVAGDITFDKARVVMVVATPETDALWTERARQHSVHGLADLVRAHRGTNDETAKKDYEGRYVRFNANRKTMTAQLTEETFALIRAAIDAKARELPSDGEVRWDQRMHDALLILLYLHVSSPKATATPETARAGAPVPGGTKSSRYTSSGSSGMLVVIHTTLDFLRGEEGSAEIERAGLLSRNDIERITCDARIVVAVDSDIGHTMFEGRGKRNPTPTQKREVWRRDRHCRFPGCTHTVFTQAHHVQHWSKGGLTDLNNLVLLCEHHHHRVHEGAWTVSGNANDVLTFVGPMGRPMRSRPSPLWGTTESMN
ncbi:MAG TPA: DUF222 domain-containing protein [Acidimicrobiales bacterium]|nr:DUF222 domain-containing protein [Acidimicrobiales bacterium]